MTIPILFVKKNSELNSNKDMFKNVQLLYSSVPIKYVSNEKNETWIEPFSLYPYLVFVRKTKVLSKSISSFLFHKGVLEVVGERFRNRKSDMRIHYKIKSKGQPSLLYN